MDRVIFPDGKTACFATLPVKAMVAAIRDAGLPASIPSMSLEDIAKGIVAAIKAIELSETAGAIPEA